jgi:hypothetical protein
MKKSWWLVPAALLLVIQLIPFRITNPPVDPVADFQRVANPPAEVLTSLKAACYDCHSNEVQTPWYNNLAPVSWYIANHVQEGREKLNFSEFGKMALEDRRKGLEESAESIRKGEMPMRAYAWMHPHANLTAVQRDLLLQWLDANGGEGAAAGEAGKEQTAPAKKGKDDDD